MFIRSLFSKHARLRLIPRTIGAQRPFHSPFVVLNSTPLASKPPPQPSASIDAYRDAYEKQLDHSPDPQTSLGGTRTYVVSAPDPAHAPYTVPSGAYPVSEPYLPPATGENPPSCNHIFFSLDSDALVHADAPVAS
jgi:hypothetical protein